MKPILLILLLFLGVSKIVNCQTKSEFVPLSYEEADAKADSILRLMTLEEKINYIGGRHLFYSNEVKRLGIPSLPFADAGQGLRMNPRIANIGFKKIADKSVAYPSPILLASTWNRAAAYVYAYSIGEECRAADIPVLLGPGFNLYRNAQNGRNFEYSGEDPYLTGNMISEYVSGMQATGTIATLKHFIGNDTEYYRKSNNSIIDERALHEIYMVPFKYGVDAGARAVMTSFNQVNGEYAGQSNYVINQLLRNNLGFKWLAMTDWFSVYDGEKVIKSGLSLEMPSRKATKHTDKLLEEGLVTEADINRMVKSTLRTFISMKSFDTNATPLSDDDYKRLEDVALNTAREGMVLLRNQNNILPIDKSKDQRILVTGEYLDKRLRGGGAASVKGYNNIVLKDALKEEFGEQLTFEKKPSVQELKEADIVIVSVGTKDSQGFDRPYNLPEEQEQLVQRCLAANPNTVILVSSGSAINMSKWQNAQAILYMWYMGQNGALAATEILCGKTNPSGKLPITIAEKYEDTPGLGYMPEGEELYSGFKFKGRKDVYDVNFKEGIYAGYRWYEHKNIEPLFCFGHGLSYTTFELSDLKFSSKAIDKTQNLEVKLSVKNTGMVDGAEVVQLYVSDLESSVERPVKELKGFKKVFLKAGESKEVSLVLEPHDFAFWDPQTKDWKIESGDFEIMAGVSSKDIRLKENIVIK
ncbi:beta-glucosidase family protein [Maribellus mangrovi]|uniref:beta-glucosidase family protein n=1 Tax=Maribellus mangrovi TaxID=3133146 RepID=UPI0030EE549A